MAGRLVSVVDPSGTGGTIPEEQVDSALSQGYRLPLGEDASFLDKAKEAALSVADIGATAGQGAAEGLTGGLAGVAVGALGDEGDKARWKEQAERSPIAHGAGELLGMVASPLNKVGEAVEGAIGATSALGKVGASALGGAATQSLFGAGHELSEQVLGDSDLNAQKLIAAGGLGAIMGGAGGGVGALLGEGASLVAKKAADLAESEGVQKFASERWLKAGGAIQSTLKKIPEGDRPAVANVIRDYMAPNGKLVPRSLDDALGGVRSELDRTAGQVVDQIGIPELGDLKPGMPRDEAARLVGGARDTNLTRASDVMERARSEILGKRADATAQLTKELGLGDLGGLKPEMPQEESQAALKASKKAFWENEAEALKTAHGAGARPEYSKLLARLEDLPQGLDPAAREAIQPEVDRAKRYIQEIAERPAGVGGEQGSGFEAINRLRASLDRDTNWMADGGLKAPLKKHLVSTIRDEIDSQIARQTPEASAAFHRGKAGYAALSRAEEALSRRSSTGADALAALAENAGVDSSASRQIGELTDALQKTNRAQELINGHQPRLGKVLKDGLDVDLMPHLSPELQSQLGAVRDLHGALDAAEAPLGRASSTGTDVIRELARSAGIDSPSVKGMDLLDHAAKLMEGGIDRKTGNRWFSPTDYISALGGGIFGAATGGDDHRLEGGLTGLALGMGHKILRQNGSAIFAELASRIAASPELATIARSFAAKAAAAAPAMGQYGAILANAYARSPEEGLATHMAHAQLDPGYADAAMMAGIPPEMAEDRAGTMAHAGQLAIVQGALAQADAQLDRHIERVLSGKGSTGALDAPLGHQEFGGKRMRREDTAALDKRIDEVRQLAGNPAAIADRLAQHSGGLGSAAPGILAGKAKSIAAGMQYLASLDSEPVGRPPLAPKWVHSGDDRHRFLEGLGVVEDPLSVLQHAAAGTLTPGHVRALEAAYPELAKHITEKVADRLTDGPKVSYRQRLMLAQLTGIDPDGTCGAAACAANQAAIAGASASSGGAPGGEKKAPQSGLKTLGGVASRMALPGQQKRELGKE